MAGQQCTVTGLPVVLCVGGATGDFRLPNALLGPDAGLNSRASAGSGFYTGQLLGGEEGPGCCGCGGESSPTPLPFTPLPLTSTHALHSDIRRCLDIVRDRVLSSLSPLSPLRPLSPLCPLTTVRSLSPLSPALTPNCRVDCYCDIDSIDVGNYTVPASIYLLEYPAWKRLSVQVA